MTALESFSTSRGSHKEANGPIDNAAEKRYEHIETVFHPRIQREKLGMLSKPNKVEALVPDLDDPESLIALGLTEENGKWYVKNRIYFSDPISSDSVLIIYDRAKGDVGFCNRSEFRSIYADAAQYEKPGSESTIEYIDPDMLEKGALVRAVKCATGEFCLAPEGTLVKTNEGPVRVRPGDALIVNERKNSISGISG